MSAAKHMAPGPSNSRPSGSSGRPPRYKKPAQGAQASSGATTQRPAAASGATQRPTGGAVPMNSAVPGSRYSADALDRVKDRKHRPAPGKRRRRGIRPWQVILIALAIVVVALGVSGFFLYQDVKVVKGDLDSATQQAAVYKDALMNGKSSELSSSAQSIATSTQSMVDHTSGPLWKLAELVPVYGEDVRQARELLDSVNILTHNGLLPFSNDLNGVTVKSLVKDGGQVDVPMLQKIIDAVLNIKEPLQNTIHTVQGLKPFHIQELNDKVASIQGTLGTVNSLLDEADDVLPQLPAMLGADGQTKNYLVLALNNVETRPAGGFAGAWGTISVTDGKIAFNNDFDSFQSERLADGTSIDLSDEEVAAFDMVGARTNPESTMMTPQFPRAASMAAQAWLVGKDQAVNGVVAIDPVFLQSLLAVTGQTVDIQGVHVDGSNAATVLMHDTYWNIPVEAQDPFFAAVAGASFQAVFNGLGHADSGDLVKTVMDGALSRNFQVWMADEQQEAAIDALGFSGKLSDDPAKPVLGTYTNDYTWSKIDWYLNMNTTVGEGTKNADGSTSYQVTTTVTNAMTEEELAVAPEYVTGNNPKKRSTGDMITGIVLTAPAGGTITNVQASGGDPSAPEEFSVYGLDVWRVVTHDYTQETTTITYTVTTSPEATEPLTVARTPAARSFD